VYLNFPAFRVTHGTQISGFKSDFTQNIKPRLASAGVTMDVPKTVYM